LIPKMRKTFRAVRNKCEGTFAALVSHSGSRKEGARMTEVSKKVLYWTPRGLCIALALFLSLFAMDVFGEGLGFWRTLFALFMHLIPVFVVLLVLALAWRWEWVGAVFLTVLGCLQIRLMLSRHMHWESWAFIAGPLFVIAALFLVNWLKRTELHARK